MTRTNRIRIATASTVLAIAGLGSPVHASDYIWNTNTGGWGNPFNWLPNAVPGAGDNVFFGRVPAATAGTVFLDIGPAWQVGEVEITQQMTLDTNNRSLLADETVIGSGRLIARPVVGNPSSAALIGQTLIGTNGVLELAGNALVRMSGSSLNSGIIEGRGEIRALGDTPFSNSGIIRPDNNGGLLLTGKFGIFNEQIDLDGEARAGTLDLTTPLSLLTVEAAGLTDDFDGDIYLGVGAVLQMHTGNWRATSLSNIFVSGAENVAASQITGDHLNFAGHIQYAGLEGKLRFTDRVTFEEDATAHLLGGALLEFDGQATIEGGDYILSQDSLVRFDGETRIEGGTFNAPGVANSSLVELNGPTVWAGGATFEKSAHQNGDAQVTAPSVINASTLDMDGAGENTNWSIGNAMTVNAESIDTANNRFDGSMTIGGGFASKLTMNLQDPSDSWAMSGELNLAGVGNIITNRLEGSEMVMLGEMNVTGGRVRVAADTQFGGTAPASLSIGPGDSELVLTGDTAIANNTTISGDGRITNNGEMRISRATDFAGVSIRNGGLLEIAASSEPGLIASNGFMNTDTGTVEFTIGGYTLGTEFDAMLVSDGGIHLDGTLMVELADLDLDGIAFEPAIGDEFIIMATSGSVSGKFNADPISFANGKEFQWGVEYTPNSVILRLDAIVPSPGAVFLLGVSGLAALRRRRSLA